MNDEKTKQKQTSQVNAINFLFSLLLSDSKDNEMEETTIAETPDSEPVGSPQM